MSRKIPESSQVTMYGRIFRHENSIVYIYMRDNISLTIQEAQTLVEDVRALDNSGQVLLLIVQGINNDLSFEAQRFLGTTNGVIRLALVVHTRLQAEVGQFFVRFLGLLKSPYEMHIFSREEVAEAWLLAIP
ncbi:MAG: hypothetical protein WAS33_30230 [Candidatus Promineifilaceae bacterium]